MAKEHVIILYLRDTQLRQISVIQKILHQAWVTSSILTYLLRLTSAEKLPQVVKPEREPNLDEKTSNKVQPGHSELSAALVKELWFLWVPACMRSSQEDVSLCQSYLFTFFLTKEMNYLHFVPSAPGKISCINP